MPIIKPFLTTLPGYEMRREGIETLPDHSAIYVANHTLAIESLHLAYLITHETGLKARGAVKKGYMDGLGVNDKGKFGRTTKYFMTHTRQISVDRTDRSRQSYFRLKNDVHHVLFDKHENFFVHPSGSRYRDGYEPIRSQKVDKFHSFFVRLGMEVAAQEGQPIDFVPVGIYHEHPFKPRSKFISHYNFGEPISTAEFDGNGTMKARADNLTNELEQRVLDLSGLESSGEFVSFD